MKTLNYDQKTRVILKINSIQPKLRYTIYYKDLESLRNKYIYKDISITEFKKDYRTLKLINEITLIKK